ncbi:MAG TPA: sulfatase-like hydrolase/transferase, partial [Pirellula sp.]|nr:sulfatase-like hydrolase/transferase [Pirellula sp.]
QSYKTLSCYPEAPSWVKTPNIDKLAKSGIRFERAYLGAWCMPSRASFLTGRFQHAVESMTMAGSYPGSTYDPKRCPFAPKHFRQSGYQTAQIGKWHTGVDSGYGRDWDYQVVWNRPAHPENAGNYYYDQILAINGKEEKSAEYSTDHYSKLGAEFIQGKNRNADQPWFLWVCYGAIHGPTTPAERHLRTLNGNDAPLPADILGPWPEKPAYLNATSAWTTGPNGRPQMKKRNAGESNFDVNESGKGFDAWIQQMNECNLAVDDGVGKLMAALQESGQLTNTLVIYTADQGYALGEHGCNQKVAPYDACVASPLIISQPGTILQEKKCKHPVTAPDLIELCCNIAKVEVPWKMHGRDIRPLLINPESTDWSKPMIMTHTGRSYGAETDIIPIDNRLTDTANVPWYVLLRNNNYKYIRTFVENEVEEVYDLEVDPEELVNLATDGTNRPLLERLRAEAIEELRKTDAKFVDRLPKTRPQRDSASILRPKSYVSYVEANGPSIYWIDVEGGAATLIVTPEGESVLIDSGNPGYRDADRIAKVATKEAGLKRIDHLITTHYHRDHFGGASTLAKILPIGTVWDNGVFEGQREKADPDYYEFEAAARRTISAGDTIELKSGVGMPILSLRCLAARQKFVPIIESTAKENASCQSVQQRPVDLSDNANSVVMLLRYGDFDFLDTGDLTWNSEFDLVCPKNRVGKVDLFQSSHHGLDQSNNPVLIKSIEPRVAIINNGTKKGCMPMMFSTLKETPSIQAIYQMHKNLRDDGSVNNVADEYIANQLVECKGEHIRVSVAADGKSYRVSIPSTAHDKRYDCVP